MSENGDSEDNNDKNQLTIKSYKGRYFQISDKHQYYLLDPHKYEISKLMGMLDISKLNKLEGEFKKYKEQQNKDGIEKQDFIELLLRELIVDEDDKINLVYGLYKLFSEIDFNGDSSMQWEEFTQFIIDSVMGETKAKEEEEAAGGGKDLSEKQLKKFKRYSSSTQLEDKSLHDTDIIDACFSPKLDKLFIVENRSKKLKHYLPKPGYPNSGKAECFDLGQFFKESNSNKGDKKKKIVDSKQALTFCILSIAIYPLHSVIALCLTNKKILFFQFLSDGKEEFKYEINTPTLQKKVWYLPDHNIWLSSGVSEGDISPKPYHDLNELDIEFEFRNQKLDILSNIGAKIDERTVNTNPYRYTPLGGRCHSEEITDLIEIRKPQLILTACMDRLIRLISLSERTIKAIWNWDDKNKKVVQHTSAIRSLDYNPTLGVGVILTVGFEYYINVWSPEVALNEAYRGKLEGHYSPVITCKFLSTSPMCVSVDEEGNIRVWDTRQLLCLQLIPQEKKNFKVNKLLTMPKYNKFILYGNKIMFFDAKYKDSDVLTKNQKVEDFYPIKVEFNKYYMNFYVTTQRDVRIYNANNGECEKTFKTLRNFNTETDSKIKFFVFDSRHRKFYLGFTSGAIQQFNAGNGSLIKRIGETEDETDGISCLRYDHSGEVSNIIFDPKNHILLSSGLDSLINIYDDENPEITIKLRTIRGGHKIADRINPILSMDFSPHMNLFATGSSDAIVTIWDYEVSKIEESIYLPNPNKDRPIDVFCLKFLDPFPILVCCYSDGTVYFNGVKKIRESNILKARNYSWNGAKDEVVPDFCMAFTNYKMGEITRKNKPNHNMKSDNNLSSKNILQVEAKQEEIPEEKTKKKPDEKDKKNIKKSIVKDEEIKEPVEIVDDVDHTDNELELDYHKINANDEDLESTIPYLILGDAKGFIKIWDIRGIIKKYGITEETEAIIKSDYNIKKKDEINVEIMLSSWIQKDRKWEKFTNIQKHVLVVEFQAHADAINSISLIENPRSFITCSKDKKFKVWGYENGCEMLAEVNIAPTINKDFLETNKPKWKFKIDWEKLKEDEILEIIKMYQNVGGEYSKKDDNLPDETDNIANQVEIKKNIQLKKQQEKLAALNALKKNKRYRPLLERKDDGANAAIGDEGDLKMDDQYVQEIIKKIKGLIEPTHEETGLYEMSKKLLYKEELDNLFKNDLNKVSNIPKQKKVKTKAAKAKVIMKDSLFSEKFKRRANSINDGLILPKLQFDNKEENIKFKKGETDRILSYQYYLSSFNNCCEIKKNQVSNESLRKNYNMMWNFVQDYTGHKKK